MASANSKWPIGLAAIVVVIAGILALTRHPSSDTTANPVNIDNNSNNNIVVTTPTSAATRTVLIADTSNQKGGATLKIVDADETVRLDRTVNINVNSSGYTLVGNHIYYLNQLGPSHIEWLDVDGTVHSLAYTDIQVVERATASAGGVTSFVVAPDESQIAWATVSMPINNQLTETIWVADMASGNVKQVFQETGDAEAYLDLMHFDARGYNLYFKEEHGGIGGYILLPAAWPVKVVELATKAVSDVAPKADDLDPTNTMYVYGTDKALVIQMIQTDAETFVPIDVDPSLGGGVGGAEFSPDGTEAAFMVNQGDPDTGVERWRVMVYDVVKKTTATLSDVPGSGKPRTLVKWLSDDLVLMQDTDGGWWTAHADGSGLTPFTQ